MPMKMDNQAMAAKVPWDRISFDDEIQKNKLKSFILIISVFVIFLVLGYIISAVLDPSYFFIIMCFSVIFSIIYILAGYYNSDKISLASVHAKPASSHSEVSNRDSFHNINKRL